MEGAERLLGEQGVRRWSARSVILRCSETLLGGVERRPLQEMCKIEGRRLRLTTMSGAWYDTLIVLSQQTLDIRLDIG